ncbi:MAG: hypothetical protein WKF53_10185 [Rubrobacter sp.]
MSLTIRRSKTSGFEETLTGCWNEDDRRVQYNALSDACWIYQYRDLEHNLHHFGWRQARKRILQHGALSGEWMNRGRGACA